MKVVVLAEQNFNLIDGSTIWILNVCKLLALQPDFEIVLLMSHRLENRVLADELPQNVTVVDMVELGRVAGGTEEHLTADTLVPLLTSWEAVCGAADRYFVRGAAYLETMIASGDFCRRLVGYAPGSIPDLSKAEPGWVVMGRDKRVPLVVQSDIAKRAMESLYDYPAHVVHVVPPIVFPVDPPQRADDGPVTLCYSGKIDVQYGLDWLIEIATAIQDMPGLGLSIIAGKDTHRARNAEFFRQMDAFRSSLANGGLSAVSLITGVPHADAKARMAEADFAYCLRHARYDDVIEISTKIVEFCTLGVPPILNDNALNRALFGEDYPYFVNITAGDVVTCVPELLKTKGTEIYAKAKARIADVAAQFSAGTLSERLGQAVRGYAQGLPALSDAPRSILIATHERKFLQQFLDRLRSDGNITVQWETWATTSKPAEPPYVPDDTDTVFCEWCCENAVWHSQNKREGTRLIIRLHRFEVFRDFPARVAWGNVDALIVVSDHFRDLMIQDHGVDPDIIHVMPQFIDWHGLQRPKLEEARLTLGLVGINPFEHKRFDRAIDFFAALRARDPRFLLAVRSLMPWQIDWVWQNREETREKFMTVFDRIETDPALRDAVRFDPPGPDMEEWYRGIGFILSSSDSEGCHTSVIEAMASGAYPVVHDWPGARGLFAPYVHTDMKNAIDDVIAFANSPEYHQARQALSQRERVHDVEYFTQMFVNL